MNILWLVFSGRMNVKTKAEKLMKKINLEDTMNMIVKECKDEGGCKGGGSVCEISRLMKNFKDR